MVAFGTRQGPAHIQYPYLLRVSTHRAEPKSISGRTSYLRVRLEFLLYPQVIPQFCNIGGSAPPVRVTEPSHCPWVAHPVSGRIDATWSRYSHSLSLRLQTSTVLSLWRRRSTRRLILQEARTQAALAGTALVPTVGRRFQELFHSPRRGAFHLSLTVLVPYRSQSVP